MKLTQDQIRDRLRARGVRVTPQRAAIYRALAERVDHPTAEALYRQVRRLYPRVSPNTVYYTLGVLKQAGLVQEVNYWHDRARFDAEIGLHHHLICLGCRKIQDVKDRALDRLAVAARWRGQFRVIGHRVEFHGYCAACRRRAPRNGRRRRSDH